MDSRLRGNPFCSRLLWSKVVIGGVLLGSALTGSTQEAQAAGWVNRRGGGGAWADGGGSWANRRGVGAWADR